MKSNLHTIAVNLGISQFQILPRQQPTALKHGKTMWFLFNDPKVLETPPQSPDLNQIENYNFERKKFVP